MDHGVILIGPENALYCVLLNCTKSHKGETTSHHQIVGCIALFHGWTIEYSHRHRHSSLLVSQKARQSRTK